ncbi:MAG: hypothetical protein ACTSWY_05310 [Promethearchaeota archaeon]
MLYSKCCKGGICYTANVDINNVKGIKGKGRLIANVHTVLKKCINKNRKFDLILIDPPYNQKYNKKYKTAKFNDFSDEEVFLRNLISKCLKILNPNGFLISKNWRIKKRIYSHVIKIRAMKFIHIFY